MRRVINTMILGGVLLAATACDKDLELYDTEDCWLNFSYSENSGSLVPSESSYSFVYAGSDVTADTIWVEITTMGFVYDTPRTISVEQVQVDIVKPELPEIPQDSTGAPVEEIVVVDTINAVPGKHYVPFNDESLAQYFQIPAGAVSQKIPVVLKRDASLDTCVAVLKFQIKENEFFKVGYEDYSTRQITFTDMLSKPSQWEYGYMIYYYGEYGPVKHQFLIDQTGEPWDDEYIVALHDGDSAYLEYLMVKMQNQLDALNAERVAQGLDVLKEADGTEVYIGMVY